MFDPRNMFPENIVQATMQQMETTYKIVNTTTPGRDPVRYKPVYKDGINILGKPFLEESPNNPIFTGIIAFCISFGIVISQLGERARIMVEFFAVLDMAIMRLVSLIMCAII